MLRISQVKIKPGHPVSALKGAAAGLLRIPEEDITGIKIIRQSLDARKKPDLYYSYSLEVALKDEEKVLRRFR